MPTSAVIDSVATPDPPGDRTLARLTGHVRALLPVAAVVVIATVDEERRRVERAASWCADGSLDEMIVPAGGHAVDERLRRLIDALLGRDAPLFISRLGKWELAPELLAALVESQGPERARAVWRAHREAVVIASPVSYTHLTLPTTPYV